MVESWTCKPRGGKSFQKNWAAVAILALCYFVYVF